MRWIKCSERLPTKKGWLHIRGLSKPDAIFYNVGDYLHHEIEWLDESESPSPVEVEAAAKERYPDFVFNGVMGPVSRQREQEAVEQRREDFIAGANFRANHLGEDREGQDETLKGMRAIMDDGFTGLQSQKPKHEFSHIKEYIIEKILQSYHLIKKKQP